MPKRKREDEARDQDSQIEDQALRIKVSRLRAKLDQALKSLTPALRLARGFERQKLGRRQKAANDDPHTLLRLREEVIVLKQLQLGETGKNHLIKHLSRTKRIRESPAFIHIYGENPSVAPAQSGAEANVLGRLFNSAPVKQALDAIMKSVFGVLGIPRIHNTNGDQKTKEKGRGKEQIALAPEDDEFNGFSSSASHGEVQLDRKPPRLATDGSEEIDLTFDHRLAPSAEDGGNSEGLSEDQNYEQRDVSISSTNYEEDVSLSNERTHAKPRDITTTSKTAFLPSLSMGGYYSGSESGGDDEVGRRSPPLPEGRKNRRGQRARQQLAEKRFGQRAKHLQKQKTVNLRNSGWDAKRGAVSPPDSMGQRTRQNRPSQRISRGKIAEKDQAKQYQPKSRDDQGSIHPSWEAAKKRKMQDQGQIQFAGKRITFD
ncbi:uncharacterized protein A1O9_12475 [Exophiala aquamarina CBS 119918]|uniref:Bud22 domain-containing protein n=1 Tax=Exophiala aquamarina CBS 119918 TaxID=1182545 RepID=A0A072NWZ3_9EURO|nr:uncharacterized protein A1O9_12475 [Exophiala aquamarina CBS 119918]KEF51558.1 hypothetical protein A1O9_12475 [Exophiala aquamarina CBS 119918]